VDEDLSTLAYGLETRNPHSQEVIWNKIVYKNELKFKNK
jgi:hypothetical protein